MLHIEIDDILDATSLNLFSMLFITQFFTRQLARQNLVSIHCWHIYLFDFFFISNLSNFTFLHPTDKGRTNYMSVHAYEICNNMFNRHRRINRFPYTYRFYYFFIVETSSLLHTTKKTSGLSSIKKVEGKLENNESTKSNFG